MRTRLLPIAPAATNISSSPSPLRECSGRRYALLYRGESHHWGCDAAGRYLQRLCMLSHRAMVIEPIEQSGGCVDVFLALNRKCHVSLPGGPPAALDTDIMAETLHGGARVHVIARPVKSWSQASNFRHALNLVLRPACDSFAVNRRHAAAVTAASSNSSFAIGGAGVCHADIISGGSEYDVLIVTRYDVRLLTPLPRWACHADAVSLPAKIGVASRCGSQAWRGWHCSFDTLFVVPRAHWRTFDMAIGKLDPPNGRTTRCCFNDACMAPGTGAGTGQACVNVLVKRLAQGLDGVSFCFPPPSHGGSHPPNGPDYQCCSRGLTNWTRVYEIESARDPTGEAGAFAPTIASSGWATLSDRYRAWQNA